ncbi:MAG TPA: hypothetical protein VHZ06_09275 [Marmoricola sp.]|jgi:hypothetical protein|nr:hypothetical protein [Marmoricola sp.]
MSRIPTALAAATILTLALAGCGSSSSSAKALTKAQWTTKTNAICKTYSAKTAALEPANDASSADVDSAVKKVADLVVEEVGKIKELKEPSSISSDVSAMLDNLKTAAATLKSQGVAALSGTTNPFEDANTKATALGLTDCVS